MSKNSKWRFCPALDQEISSAQCGEQRQSRLACPPTCEYNPFAQANYAQSLQIEDRLDQRCLERWHAMAADGTAVDYEVDAAQRGGPSAIHAYFAWRLFFATDADQTTFAQRWEQDGIAELKNDERVLWRAKSQMRIALVEIHQVSIDGRIEAVDLLSSPPAPLILQDKSVAAVAVRFSTFLTWIFPLPHFWRLSGTGNPIADVAGFSAVEVVREIVRHLGGPSTEPEIRRWLAENFMKFDAAQVAVHCLRRRQLLAGIDAKFGKAIYELRAPFAQCRERLDAFPNIAHDQLADQEQAEGFVESRGWLDASAKSKNLKATVGQVLLGRVLLGQTHWRLEAFGAEKLARLRRQFEDHFGERVRFCGERVDDLGARLNAREPVVDESLAPPRLLENPDQIVVSTSPLLRLPPQVTPQDAEHAFKSAADRAFLDQKIPLLDQHTPREAALDLILRPKLLRLMKQRVRLHDERNLKTGRTDDMNWMLDELNLAEINFAAPSWRPPPEPADHPEDDREEPADFDGPAQPDLNRPPPPPLLNKPLGLDEVNERLDRAMSLFSTAAEAERELEISGATLLQDTDELTRDLLSETDFCFAIPFLMQAWFTLVPAGCRAPEFDLSDLQASFTANLSQLRACLQAGNFKKMESFLRSGSQPELTLVLLGLCLGSAGTAPKNIRPSRDAESVIMALLKSVVEMLDHVLRRKPPG
jgi:hypothetical protein